MKEKTSTRLKQIMNERDLKQVDILNKSLPFQKKLNIKMGKSALSQYVNDVQSPDQDRIYLLSQTLNVSEAWLMGFDAPKYKQTNIINLNKNDFNKYNFYDTTIAAGMLAEVNPFTRNDVKKISLSDDVMGKYAGDKDIFISRINGHSMNRIIPDNSLIAVKNYDSLADLNEGDIVVFQDGGDMSVKRYYNSPKSKTVTFSPYSTDDCFSPITYRYEDLDDIKVLGKVVVYIINLK